MGGTTFEFSRSMKYCFTKLVPTENITLKKEALRGLSRVLFEHTAYIACEHIYRLHNECQLVE